MVSQSWPVYGLVTAITWACIALFRALHSPVSKVPGPFYSKVTGLWLIFKEFTSNRRSYIHDMHAQYGPVVRLGPNEVSFTSADAIKEIYTSGGSGYDKTEFYTLFMQFGARYFIPPEHVISSSPIQDDVFDSS